MHAVLFLHLMMPIWAKLQSCSIKFEHLPSVNLVWYDMKIQHDNTAMLGIEVPSD